MLKSAKPRESGPWLLATRELRSDQTTWIASSGGRVPVLMLRSSDDKNGSDAAMTRHCLHKARKYPARGGKQMVPALLVGILLGAAALRCFRGRQIRRFGPAVRRAPGEHAGGRQQPTVSTRFNNCSGSRRGLHGDKVVSGEKEN